MKNIPLVIALSWLLLPAIASAEFNYTSIHAGYAITKLSGRADNKQYYLDGAYGILNNVFIEGNYTTANQPSGTSSGDFTDASYAVGAGYHTPLENKVDFIVAGYLNRDKKYLAGASSSSSGFSLDVGLRQELAPKLESLVSARHFIISRNSLTTTGNGIRAEIGFQASPEIEWFVRISSDSYKPQMGSSYNALTIDFGARFYQ